MSPISTAELRRQQAIFLPHESSGLTSPASSRIATVTGAFLRLTAVAAGAGILAASTNAIIAAQNLNGPDALSVAALAAGVAVGSIVIPRAKRALAAALLVGLLAGEGYGLIVSAERIIERRSASTAVVTQSSQVQANAKTRLAKAETALGAQRVNAANTSALPDCGKGCRATLDAQASDLKSEIEAARKAVNEAPAPKSAHPLADKLGMSPVTLDLLAAALLSLATTVIAATLVCWGARPAAPLSAAPLSAVVSPAIPEPVVEAALPQQKKDSTARTPAKRPGKAMSGKSKQAPGQPAVKRAEAQIIDIVRANNGSVKTSVRGLAALIGDVSKSTTATALAGLVASGALVRAGDVFVLAQQAA